MVGAIMIRIRRFTSRPKDIAYSWVPELFLAGWRRFVNEKRPPAR
jgi:hypothetical protein